MKTNLRYEIATPATEPELRKLLRENPVTGEIHVSLEREPNAFYAAAVSGDKYQLILAYKDDDPTPVGLGSRFELDVFINGQPQTIGYLSELRASGGFRFRRNLLLAAYRSLRKHHESGNAAFYLTTIIADNTAARRLLEAGLSDMPTYSPMETMTTLTIPVRSGARVRAGKKNIEPAGENLFPAIARKLMHHGQGYQFYPCWMEQTLNSNNRCRDLSCNDFLVHRRGGDISGSLALWDQRSFKQAVIRSYSKRLNRLRPAYNIFAPLLRRPPLPAPGARLESGFLSHLMVDPQDEETIVSLVHKACCSAARRKLDYVMIGVAERNPICRIIQRHFVCYSYVSMIYVVYWEDGRREAEKLDKRLPHPELAIL